MKRIAWIATCTASAVLSGGFAPHAANEPEASSAHGDGSMTFGHDEDGRGLLKFEITDGPEVRGSLLFAGEDHHDRFPHIVVRLGTIEKCVFGADVVEFSGPGRLHDDPVRVRVRAWDHGATEDEFHLECVDAHGEEVLHVHGHLFRGDIVVTPK